MTLDAAAVRDELLAREPLFHHEQLGAGREAFAALIVDDYWEVGASGSIYDREFVLDTLVKRYSAPHDDPWEISDFAVRHVEGSSWLTTYELRQAERVTRRSTLWQLTDNWRALYHQGTISPR